MITVVGDRVLLQQQKEESKVGLMTTEARRLPRGKVIGVGTMGSNDLKDKTVLFNDMAGQRIEDGGVEYLIIKTQDVLAIVE